MKQILISLICVVLFLAACSKKNESKIISQTDPPNRVLFLMVDYKTKVFEGGKEFYYFDTTSAFTISSQYVPPNDFGSIKLFYQELHDTLFYGSIVWNGCGHINFPKNIIPSYQFDTVTTSDTVMPLSGFVNATDTTNNVFYNSPVWPSIQKLVIVRQYLSSNPNGTVRIYLYAPSVGMGNPADWDWIIFLKN